jgi:hypothetical protein
LDGPLKSSARLENVIKDGFGGVLLEDFVALREAEEADEVFVYGVAIVDRIIDWEPRGIAVGFIGDDNCNARAVIGRKRGHLRHRRWLLANSRVPADRLSLLLRISLRRPLGAVPSPLFGKSPSFSVEDCYETTRHQIDQIGPNVCVYGYRWDFSDHQAHQFELLHDDLLGVGQLHSLKIIVITLCLNCENRGK